MSRGAELVQDVHETSTPIGATVAAVVDWLLEEILSDRLPPGSVVRDLDVARTLGVSRTPVREAILLLRGTGLLEVVASRYTRVASIDAEAAGQLHRVWTALLRLAVEDILHGDSELDVGDLVAAHEASRRAADDPRAFAVAARDFYGSLLAGNPNPHLRRAIQALVPTGRLALATAREPGWIAGVIEAQSRLVAALRAGDSGLATAAIDALRDVEARPAG